MPTALPTTTVAFGSAATEAEFKTFISAMRDYLAGLFGTDGVAATAIATLGASPFPAGTPMLFAQSTAPTGWTKSTAHNDKTLRVVSGTAGSGGVQAFSTVFGRTAVDASSLSKAQLAAHSHYLISDVGTSAGSPKGLHRDVALLGSTQVGYDTSEASTSNTGSGSTHTHGLDLRVAYLDVIVATKD